MELVHRERQREKRDVEKSNGQKKQNIKFEVGELIKGEYDSSNLALHARSNFISATLTQFSFSQNDHDTHE